MSDLIFETRDDDYFCQMLDEHPFSPGNHHNRTTVNVTDGVYRTLNHLAGEHQTSISSVTTTAQQYTAKRMMDDYDIDHEEFDEYYKEAQLQAIKSGKNSSMVVHSYDPTRPELTETVATYLPSRCNNYRDEMKALLNNGMSEAIRFAIYHALCYYDFEAMQGEKWGYTGEWMENALEVAEELFEEVANDE